MRLVKVAHHGIPFGKFGKICIHGHDQSHPSLKILDTTISIVCFYYMSIKMMQTSSYTLYFIYHYQYEFPNS